MANNFELKDIYDLVDRHATEHREAIREVRTEIANLRTDFLEFERGRLTTVEKQVASLNSNVNASQLTDAPMKKLAWKVVEYVILAVVAAVLFLVLKNSPL